jgi:hypothetical protein
MKRKVQRYKAGDIFSFELVPGEYLSARILLDIKKQCIQSKLISSGNPLYFFGSCVLVEAYSQSTPEPTAVPSDILIPGIFIGSNIIARGVWKVIGHEPVDPTTVEFPEALIGSGPRVRFNRGEVELSIQIEQGELDHIKVYNMIHGGGFLPEICLTYLGRGEEINNPLAPDLKRRGLEDCDLRFSEHREEVYSRIDADPNESYYELSKRLGHDITRFY